MQYKRCCVNTHIICCSIGDSLCNDHICVRNKTGKEPYGQSVPGMGPAGYDDSLLCVWKDQTTVLTSIKTSNMTFTSIITATATATAIMASAVAANATATTTNTNANTKANANATAVK